MFSIQNLVQPNSIEEAYNILISKRNNRVLGGCAFLRLGSKRIATALDLSKLDLAFIKEQDGYIEIGALTTYRDLEVSAILVNSFNGVVPKAVSNIIGVQFRNMVTVGASVYAKYGFSDLITALLVLDTEVELYKAGRMSLRDFLNRPRERDILTRIFIRKNQRQASYHDLRKSASDFPILNVAVSKLDNQWIITVGARPHKAVIAHKASEELSKNASNENIECLADLVAQELSFGTNARATAKYREAICKTLVKRAITEVLQCK